jgi:hypothetical protein
MYSDVDVRCSLRSEVWKERSRSERIENVGCIQFNFDRICVMRLAVVLHLICIVYLM